jgi:glycosyltransferase involved in cell wall biosynthesis
VFVRMDTIISTIIAAYNAEKTIRDAVDSALAQQFDGNETIVVDDASTDSTVQILKAYGDRIRLISTTVNGGPARARNLGVIQSKAEFIAFLDSDDLWRPTKLKTMATALKANPRASLAFSEYTIVEESGVQCGHSSIGHAPSMDEMMRTRPPIIPSTWLVRREKFERAGGFSEAFRGAGLEDSWMVILLRELGEFEYVPQPLTMYRTAASGTIADKYGCGLNTFISLARDRFGARSRELVRNAKALQCRWMLSKVAHQMNRGDRTGALRTLAAVAFLKPGYFLSTEFVDRFLLSHNQKRFRELAAVRSRARWR